MKVVVADDSSIMRNNAKGLLTQLGHDVVASCEDGVQVFAAIKEFRPELAVLDFIMPHMTGGDVIKAVKQNHLPTKIILATSMGQRATIQDPGVQADGVIIKPYVLAIMRLEIAKLFG